MTHNNQYFRFVTIAICTATRHSYRRYHHRPLLQPSLLLPLSLQLLSSFHLVARNAMAASLLSRPLQFHREEKRLRAGSARLDA